MKVEKPSAPHSSFKDFFKKEQEKKKDQKKKKIVERPKEIKDDRFIGWA